MKFSPFELWEFRVSFDGFLIFERFRGNKCALFRERDNAEIGELHFFPKVGNASIPVRSERPTSLLTKRKYLIRLAQESK